MLRFVCLMTTGKPLTNDVRYAVLRAGYEMFATGSRRQAFKSESCEGIVATEGKWALLGSIGGVMVEATIESDNGKTSVQFLMDPEAAAKMTGDGYRVRHSPAAARNATYN